MFNKDNTVVDAVSKNPLRNKIVVGALAAAVVAVAATEIVSRVKRNSEGVEVEPNSTVEA